MKTESDIDYARSKIIQQLSKANSKAQEALLIGMLNALCWVRELPSGSTTQRVVDGDD